jgi:hypothetical protein
LQQFAHSIGITLYEGYVDVARLLAEVPGGIKEDMYFAIETFAGHPGLEQTARLEENVLVSVLRARCILRAWSTWKKPWAAVRISGGVSHLSK